MEQSNSNPAFRKLLDSIGLVYILALIFILLDISWVWDKGLKKEIFIFLKKDLFIYILRESLHMQESAGWVGGQWERICKQTPCWVQSLTGGQSHDS